MTKCPFAAGYSEPVAGATALGSCEEEAAQSTGQTKNNLTTLGQTAWRNHAACIGRLFWQNLAVRDRRGLTRAGEILDQLFEHLGLATNHGKIKPLMTVFAPNEPSRSIRIVNDRLCGYACYRSASGELLGDPKNRQLTQRAISLGWQPPSQKTAFDLLPAIVQGMDGEIKWAPLPAQAVTEVLLSHPDCPSFANLGLRWYAVPLVCNMDFVTADQRYSAAPFNGWYMGTEIGARNLSDQSRYNILPAVASCFGWNIGHDSTLWKDRALVELNVAVLYSFKLAGVTIVDHHTASREFERFCQREAEADREVSAKWDWIIPPLSPATTSSFHTPMKEFHQLPNFFRRKSDAS